MWHESLARGHYRTRAMQGMVQSVKRWGGAGKWGGAVGALRGVGALVATGASTVGTD